MQGNGHDRWAEELGAVLASWDDAGADPLEDLYRSERARVVEAMSRLGYDRARLDAVEVQGLLHTTVSARIDAFDDGSAAVLISDTLLAIAEVYATQLALAICKRGLANFLRSNWRMLRTGRADVDVDRLAVVLRYNMISQRTLGFPTALTSRAHPQQAQYAESLLRYCLQFIVAHEFAHHLLGHTTDTRLSGPGVASCTAAHQLELDADRLAITTVLEAERAYAGTNLVAHAALGMLVAILVLLCAESSLYIHTGRSHPEAALRGEQLLDSVPLLVVPTLSMYMTRLREATQRAALFTPGHPSDVDWARFHADEDLIRPGPVLGFYDHVVRCDQAQSWDPPTLTRWLGEQKSAWSFLRAGLGDLAGGHVVDALQAWGMSEAQARSAVDPTEPLSFYAVVRSMRGHPGLSSLDPAERNFLTSVVGGLVEHRLKSKGNE